jgi:hypothetical protein
VLAWRLLFSEGVGAEALSRRLQSPGEHCAHDR